MADAVVLVHLGFILFVLFGGLLALRWPRAAWLHIPAAAWGAAVELGGRVCPLTPLENSLRRASGAAGYPGGFVEHYVIPLIYPGALTRELQLILGAGVILLNVGVYVFVWRKWRTRRTLTARDAP